MFACMILSISTNERYQKNNPSFAASEDEAKSGERQKERTAEIEEKLNRIGD